MPEHLMELRVTFIYIYQFIIKDIVKDMCEQPDEELHRLKSRKVPSAGASVPMELGCMTLLSCRCVDQPRNSLNPILLGFLWRFHYIDMIDHQVSLQPLSHSWRVGGRAEYSKHLIMAWSFW